MIKKLFFVTLLTTAACATEGDDPVDESTSEITGGTLVTSNVYPYDAVIRFKGNNNPGGCTATKIGARRLITAAHCLEDGNVTVGGTIKLTNRLDGDRDLGGTFTVDATYIHPGRQNATFARHRSYDIALIDLTTDLPSGWTTLPLREDYVGAGVSGRFVGYGCDDTSTHDGQKQRASFTTATEEAWRAQAPDSNKILGDYVYWAVFDGGGTVRSCAGDSGAPWLFWDGSRWEVGAIDKDNDAPWSMASRISNVWRWLAHPNAAVGDARWGFWLNGKSNLCIGVPGGSTAEGAHLAQYFCDGRKQTDDNQYWQLQKRARARFYQIVNGKSGKCIGVRGGSAASGAQIVLDSCDAAPDAPHSQVWEFDYRDSDGKIRLKNSWSGMCIGVDEESTSMGRGLYQYPCDGGADQGWDFIP
jgi:V8-like Glu-specific endopeptidase